MDIGRVGEKGGEYDQNTWYACMKFSSDSLKGYIPLS